LRDATFYYNDLEGEVSPDICNNVYQEHLRTITVDCNHVTCECCLCMT